MYLCALKVEFPSSLRYDITTSIAHRCLQTTEAMMEQSDRALSWEVREELREAFGIHYSDKRSTRSQLEARC